MAERKFIYAPDMQQLKAKVDEVKQAVAHVEHLYELMTEANDWKARFEYLLVSVQDFGRGVRTAEELQSALRITMEGVEDELSPEVRS